MLPDSLQHAFSIIEGCNSNRNTEQGDPFSDFCCALEPERDGQCFQSYSARGSLQPSSFAF